MAWYRELEPQQEPFDGGVDDLGRARVVFNIRAVKEPSATFLQELVKLLVDEGVGTFNTNIFASSASQMPAGDGPFLTLYSTGGMTPERTHNSVSRPAYVRPSAQVVVRARSYVTALTMAQAAYDAFVGIRNRNVTP